MSLYSAFGCLFIAYGPILSIFFLFIGRNAQYVLLMVSSAFFCLIALLLSSVIWYFATATQTTHVVSITYSVAIQEIFRWFFYKLLSRAETGLNIVSANPKSPLNRSMFAFVAGFGYALMCALVSYISLLVESIGPGVIVCPSCPQTSLFFISAITTSLFSLMHMAWMMLAFEGFGNIRKPAGLAKVVWVVLSHYGASFATMMNSSTTIYLGCVYSIVCCLCILVISVTWAVFALRARYRLSLSR